MLLRKSEEYKYTVWLSSPQESGPKEEKLSRKRISLKKGDQIFTMKESDKVGILVVQIMMQECPVTYVLSGHSEAEFHHHFNCQAPAVSTLKLRFRLGPLGR